MHNAREISSLLEKKKVFLKGFFLEVFLKGEMGS